MGAFATGRYDPKAPPPEAQTDGLDHSNQPLFLGAPPDPHRQTYIESRGNGGAGGLYRGGPLCRPGYVEGPDGRCVGNAQTQIQDLALQQLRNTVNGGGGGTSRPTVATPSQVGGSYMPPGYPSSSTSSTTTTTTSSPHASQPRVEHADATLASNAALLRAKENQGQIARSSLTGLRSVLGERQMLGSGAEAGATGDIAAKALSSLSDVNREQQIQNDETARQYGLANYQGDISQRATDLGSDVTQRGQDIGAATTARGQDIGANVAYRGQDVGAMTAYRGQDVTQRGQDIQAQQFGQTQYQSQLQAALEALRQQLY